MEHEYKSLVYRLIDWERVSERLSRFSHIQQIYPLSELQLPKYSEAAPFYSHPLAYQLGVWDSEDRTRFLDELLAHAATIPGWRTSRGATITREFHTLHGLMWELQTAKFLTERSVTDMKWLPSGPDLEVKVDNLTMFVECYCYSKFYAKLIFLEDLLRRIDRRLHAKCPWAIKPQFPATDEGFGYLLELVIQQVTPESIQKLERSDQPYVYLKLPDGTKNIHVYFENEDVPIRNHEVLHIGAGDTDLALQVAVQEALDHKASSNSLATCRPNLVAINMSLCTNFILGRNRAIDLKIPPPDVELADIIDGAVLYDSSTSSFDTVFDESLPTAIVWKAIVGRN